MSVTSNIRKAGPYTGNGITTSYPFAFKVFNTSEVLVVQTDVAGSETTLALTTDYTVTLNADQDANPGGTVDMLVAPAVGVLITLTSSVDETQSVTLTNQGGFYPAVINDALDRLTIITQQILESLGRKIGYGVSDTTTGVIPAANERANKFLAFDSSGNVVTSAVSIGTISSSIVSDLVTMRAGTVTNGEIVDLKYHTTSADGGGGRFRGVTGAAPGTYTDNNGTIIVPTGGDGSAAWLRETNTIVQAEGFGVVGDATTDNQPSLTTAQTNVDVIIFKNGTYAINSTLIIQAMKTIIGAGNETTIIQNNGASYGLSTVDDAAYAKQYDQWIKDCKINGVSNASPAAAGLRFIDVGKSGAIRVVVSNHETGIELSASVGTHLIDVSVTNATNGIKAGGVASLGSTTIATIDKAVVTTCINALVDTGFLKALHINDSTIENNTNIWVDSVGGGANNVVFRNVWFENNANYDLGTALSPVFDTCYFSGDIDVTGGVTPVFNNIHVTGSTNFPKFFTNREISEASVTGQTFTNSGQHGLSLSMPQIGHASTPVDKQETQACSQSKLIGELSGTLLGYSQPLQNLNQTYVGQTGYAGGKNYWPYGGTTVTTGQPDMYGGANAVKLVGGTGHGSTTIATTPGLWYVIEMAFNMIAADEKFELYAQSGASGGTLDKRNAYRVADTGLRVVHMLFKADSAGFRPYIMPPTSGIIVHRFCVFAGTQLKPMIPENANIPTPFIQEFNAIKTYGAAAPTTGTWAVGDTVINTAPAAAGAVGWVCVTAGTPGVWKTFGTIAA